MLTRALAATMESRFRRRFFGATSILEGADIQPGQTILEVGCGTGYFTLPVARFIGEQGCLVAIDVLPEAVRLVGDRVRHAELDNVRVIQCDALEAGLKSGPFHAVLLFGVIPAPMLPLGRLLPELHRLLRSEGELAVWPPIPGWLPKSILRSGLFTLSSKRKSVYNFRPC
jgi:ubiquinone/menaquinone biosynthesis C-methylase UbiE